jgi:hypothetical protein
MRYRRRIPAAGILSLAIAAACAPVKTVTPAPGVDPDLRPFLLDPASDCGDHLDSTAAAAVSAAHRELLLSGDAPAALRVADRLLENDSAFPPTKVLRAEALIAGRQDREAVKLLQPLAATASDCLPLALALGRAQETAGDPAEAFVAYMAGASRSGVAAERARALSERAQEIVRNRYSDALRAGRQEAAAWHLSRLERFWPNSEATLLSSMESARAAGDERSELAAVKALQAGRPRDGELALRRGQLELVVGDARTGLALIETLAAASPGDPRLQTELARAKFSWRMINAPEQVRRLREKAVLTRADFAVLLYWTVPQIRTARPAAARIASDIVDHPSRDEIARVANLGLLAIDETMHRFSPDMAVRRSDAISALLRLVAADGAEGACISPVNAGREAICDSGASCGLFDDLLLCQAGGGISGPEAMEMLRRALDRLEGP